ncbi:MAG: RNA pseudouridine synthase [Clostridia bacterium]|nr:RNA pseudouridine synthase [Clostridia bacterium]
MKLLYYDKHIAVAVKPRGILSQEGKGIHMLSLLSEALGGEFFPVHRLDRETAGVMVYARTQKAAAALSQSIQEGNFKKEYLAVTHILSIPQEGNLEDVLFFDRQKNKVFPVKKERRGAKYARLSYTLAEEKDDLFLFRVFPQTGRTHQIRVQFASRKMPLFGDRKYGGKGEGFGLFAHALSFEHPIEKTPLSFWAIPKDISPWNLFSDYFSSLNKKD